MIHSGSSSIYSFPDTDVYFVCERKDSEDANPGLPSMIKTKLHAVCVFSESKIYQSVHS